MLQVREIRHDEIDQLTDHLERHFSEPGFGGKPAHPYSLNYPFSPEDYKSRVLKRWETKPMTGSWEKTWVLSDKGWIVGHIELVGPGRSFLAHRAKLGMGLEQDYRRRGFGKRLLKVAVEWAKNTDFIDWIDLDVFAHNLAAISFYEQQGFTVIGLTPDRLRVDGLKVDDLQMTLNLR